jgi:hypothetical protein
LEDNSLAPSLFDVNPYSPFFKDGEETLITEIGHVSGVLARFDKGIIANNKALLHFLSEYQVEHGKAGEAIQSIWLRVEMLTSSIGMVPTCLALDYLNPSAWASIGSIADKLDALGNTRQSTQH